MAMIKKGLLALIAATGSLAAGAAFGQSTSPVAPSVLNGGSTITSNFSASYGNTYTAPQSQVGTTGYSFTDAYVFTTGLPGSFDSLNVTINLGSVLNISNFQAGVFTGTPLLGAATFDGFTHGTSLDGSGMFVGNSGSSSGAVSGLAWNAGNGSQVTLVDNSLAAGTYTLEIRGWVTGTSGGSYAGLLNIAPVPEASTFALMLAGLGLFGIAALRRADHQSR